MAQPRVCCVMLTKDRPELARRAVECFRVQTYASKCLLVWDNAMNEGGWIDLISNPEAGEIHCTPIHRETIGHMRNLAIDEAVNWWFKFDGCPDIIAHWDDDDWSAPERIAEQVDLLQSSGADVVGYNEMLFWRDPEAWLYRNDRPGYALGTSLCYWRRTWERKPFNPELPLPGGTGEDTEWLRGLNVSSKSSLSAVVDFPRMVARIHGGNTMPYDIEAKIAQGSKNWTRVPAWDEPVRGLLG